MIIPKESDSIINVKVKCKKARLKEFLKTEIELSSRLFKKLILGKNIFINGKPLKDTYYVYKYVYKNDIITLKFEQEKSVYKAQKMNLDIIYEDFDLIAINKEAYTLVHPTKNHPENTLTNALAYYFKVNNIKRKVRLVNRLDRDTSGILLVAKNPYAHSKISKQFGNDIEKKYIAIVDGIVSEDQRTIDLPISKEKEGIKEIIDKEGKRAITKFKVIRRLKDKTILSLEIITGKTHQIRVHLAHLGYPIIGDSLYGNKSDEIDRQALHSNYVKFKKVRNDEEIELIADLPLDMNKLIEKSV